VRLEGSSIGAVPGAPHATSAERKKLSPVLSWAGRTWRSGTSAGTVDTVSSEIAPRVAVSETFRGDAGRGSSRLLLGDALVVARSLLAEGLEGHADLVYLDPPFASEAHYVHEARLDGSADGRVVRTSAYSDRWRRRRERAAWNGADDATSSGGRKSVPPPLARAPGEADGVAAYLDMLAPRLEAAARLVAPSGTLWVHLDWRASYLVRVVLDEILGREHFLNEIVWRRAPNLGRQAASGQFGRTLDTILVYGGPAAKLEIPTRLEPIEPASIRWDGEGRPFTSAPRGDYTDLSITKLEAEGRVHRTKAGKVYIKYFLVKDELDRWCRKRRIDTLWTDVAPLRHASTAERTGFPTQKPLALLDRIVRCAAPEGGLVIDLFAGSGTTGVAASQAGRRVILGDEAPVALANARARLLRLGASVVIERVEGAYGRDGPPIRIEGMRMESGGIQIRLLWPREPFAWAVGVSTERSPFDVIWHSERRPGSRTVPADSVAALPSPGGNRLLVRVYGDDGAISDAEVKVP
jgi:DNA modification methylase